MTLTACITVDAREACRDFALTVRPAVALAPFTRYGMVNFARSNSEAGQQIYMAASVGNDPLRWMAVNDGHPVLRSTQGMHAVRGGRTSRPTGTIPPAASSAESPRFPATRLHRAPVSARLNAARHAPSAWTSSESPGACRVASRPFLRSVVPHLAGPPIVRVSITGTLCRFVAATHSEHSTIQFRKGVAPCVRLAP